MRKRSNVRKWHEDNMLSYLRGGIKLMSITTITIRHILVPVLHLGLPLILRLFISLKIYMFALFNYQSKFYIFSQSPVTWMKFNLPVWGKIWEGIPTFTHMRNYSRWPTKGRQHELYCRQGCRPRSHALPNSNDFTESLIQTVHFVRAPVRILSPIKKVQSFFH